MQWLLRALHMRGRCRPFSSKCSLWKGRLTQFARFGFGFGVHPVCWENWIWKSLSRAVNVSQGRACIIGKIRIPVLTNVSHVFLFSKILLYIFSNIFGCGISFLSWEPVWDWVLFINCTRLFRFCLDWLDCHYKIRRMSSYINAFKLLLKDPFRSATYLCDFLLHSLKTKIICRSVLWAVTFSATYWIRCFSWSNYHPSH